MADIVRLLVSEPDGLKPQEIRRQLYLRYRRQEIALQSNICDLL